MYTKKDKDARLRVSVQNIWTLPSDIIHKQGDGNAVSGKRVVADDSDGDADSGDVDDTDGGDVRLDEMIQQVGRCDGDGDGDGDHYTAGSRGVLQLFRWFVSAPGFTC